EMCIRDRKRIWCTADDERMCLTCGVLDGQETEMEKPFLTPNGDVIDNAPAHPHCRCGILYREEDD
ncbi:MAG: phage head morphogenesis protein, partial [Thermodesulfovibrionales bacterium]|nr:phage head morphogenesis protein [Thermodesulfovibrionales bacterium]